MKIFTKTKNIKYFLRQIKNIKADFENQKIKDTVKPRYYQKGEKEAFEKKYQEYRYNNEDFRI
jgi:hypothetical protein